MVVSPVTIYTYYDVVQVNKIRCAHTCQNNCAMLAGELGFFLAHVLYKETAATVAAKQTVLDARKWLKPKYHHTMLINMPCNIIFFFVYSPAQI